MSATNPQATGFKRISALYDKQKHAERRLIFWAMPGLILFVAVMLFIEPAFVELKKAHEKIARVDSQLQEFESTKQDLQAQAEIDPNAQTKKDIERLQALAKSLEEEFQAELNQLVSPEAMPILLGELFEKANSLTLLKMESIAPEPLLVDKQSNRKLYQHGIRITFEGAYLDTRDFLANAEDLGWKLYWKFLQYEVSDHPVATTELEVFTLSTSEAFIGVHKD